ncbi:MAG: hypothetical protein HOW73_08100 [Polyangiaceae bacterium]|nr:hypothetical protein [Polyangiaceae bacterium]
MRRSSTLAFTGIAVVVLTASCALNFSDYDDIDDESSTSTGAGGAGGAPPLSPQGTPCSSNDECIDGHCLPSNDDSGNICCATDCTDAKAASCGTNGKCDPGGGSCASYPAGTVCGETTCEDGALTTEVCQAGACAAGEAIPCAGGLACENDGKTCKTVCGSGVDCANEIGGAECPYPLSTFCIERPNGAVCDSDFECASGVCGTTGVGHCCSPTASCDVTGGPCDAIDCNSEGACEFPGADTACGDEQSCTNANLFTSQTCDDNGECETASTQQACPGHLECATDKTCHTACGSNDATGDTFCAAGYWCDGSTCQPARDEGSGCSRDGQCHSEECPPSGMCTSNCDLDGDDQARRDMKCGGLDCDDNDALTYDAQPAFFDTPRSNGSYDYNCDDIEEPKLNTWCSCPGAILRVAGGADGCGETGELWECNWSWFQCVPVRVLDDNVTQTCR